VKNLLKILAIFLIIVEIFALTPKTMQNDTFWSVKVGEELFNYGKITKDILSQNEALDYIAQHYYTDIIIYLVYDFCGLFGLYIFEIVLVTVLAIMLYIFNKQLTKRSIVSVLILIIELFLLSPYFAVRAQMVSFILFVLELILLEKLFENKKKRYLFGLGVIPILLANFHMGVVPFYFIILGVYVIGCIKSNKKLLKPLLIVGYIGLLTIFINPYYIEGVKYPFKTIGNDWINNNIQEFRPYSLSSTQSAWVLLYIFVLIILMILLNKKIQLKDYLLIFGTLFMNFMAIRYTSLFIICSIVIIRYLDFDGLFNEKDIMNNKWIVMVILLVMCILFIVRGIYSFISTEIDSSAVYPKKAIEYIKQNRTNKTIIFNEYSWGAGLMFNDIRPFIDSRCDMYTKEYNNTTIAEDYITIYEVGKDFDKLIEKYRFNTFLVQTDSSIARVFNLLEQYELVYEDELASVFIKK